jgi:hypothetical protein
MKTNPATEFVSYQSVKFASSATVALIGGILRFGLISYEQYSVSKEKTP